MNERMIEKANKTIRKVESAAFGVIDEETTELPKQSIDDLISRIDEKIHELDQEKAKLADRKDA